MQLFAFNRVLPGFCLECSNGKMENGGRFSDHQVDQLRRLGGGGVVSQKCHRPLIHKENYRGIFGHAGIENSR